MKYFIVVFIVLTFYGCGVSTDSSKTLQGSTNTDTGNNTGSTGTTTPVETNTSGGTDGALPGSGISQEPAFDTSDGAELDPNACRSAYATAVPLQDSADANSQRETDDSLNGLSLMSLYTQTFVAADSNIIAFYKTLPLGTVLQDVTKKKNVYGANSQFILVYDPAWVSTPNNIVYVQTPKLTNELPGCYRIILDDLNGSAIVPQKVYSYKQ